MFLRTDARFGIRAGIILSSLLFVALIGTYLWGAYSRHAANPDDKVMPTPSKMVEGFKRVALKEDLRGDMRLWLDTWSSMRRFGVSLGLILLAIPLGLYMGSFPFWERVLYRFMKVIDFVPGPAILAILFICFGLGDETKIALIVFSVFPTIALDAYWRAKAVPREQFFKAQSLGASEQEIAWRVVLPQIAPECLGTVRLSLKSMLQLLLLSEGIAAMSGLGYRIFLVQRRMEMDIILIYVLWMTLLAYLLDLAFQLFIRWYYPWYRNE